MKKKGIILAAMALIVFSAIMLFVDKRNEEPSNCFTWKVKINESTFYLAGSVHGGNEKNYPLPETYQKIYDKSDKVILELKESFDEIEKKMFEYAQKDTLPKILRLNDSLKPETVAKLKEITTDAELERYFSHEAWLLNMHIAGNKYKLVGYDPMLAVDKHFYDKASKDKKEIIGLDQFEAQIALFEFEVPFNVQIMIIEKAVANMKAEAEKEKGLLDAYFANDMVRFEKEFMSPWKFENPQMKNVYDQIFTNRNKSWVTKFEELSLESPGEYFVLVGTGHFFGPNNVLELLTSKGYKVEKM
jgi:uncharacterized protein YbaP (TraB family)